MIYNGLLYKHYDPCTPNESNHVNYVINNKNKVLIKKIYCEQ